jgi:isocitrate/isopropylmalate dehydrogenase
LIIDIGAAKWLMLEIFDVIVMPNLYGVMYCLDVAAQIAGSVGLAGSCKYWRRVPFEAIHGSAPREEQGQKYGKSFRLIRRSCYDAKSYWSNQGG